MQTGHSLNFGGRLYLINEPKVMGIINVTPDSFFDGGMHNSVQRVLDQAEKHLNDGADFLDIGGYSSRPGADDVAQDEELKRVLDPIKAIKDRFPEAIVSVDTFRAEVAQQAIAAGASMVNDISAGEDDPEMFDAIKELQVPYIIMHKQGSPKTMQQNPIYDEVTLDVAKYLSERVLKLNKMGVNDIMIDPGFGFGKTVEQNYQLLRELDHFKRFELPILIGISRKSMINRVLGTKPENALNGTTALHMVAMQKGAHILRVHDVKEAKQVIKLHLQMNN